VVSDLKKLGKLVLVTLISLVTLEILLRVTAPYLGADVCTALFRTYSNDKGGIYYCEPLSKCYFTLPNDHRRAAYNGHQWLHETDERGFRNPPGTAHEILIFGDSFIYGHGVEEPETAAALLRAGHGWKIYNMARQGDSLWQQYILFRLWGQELKPKHIILCVFGNDFNDIQAIHDSAALSDPPELKAGFIERVRKNLEDPQVRYQFGNWLTTSYTYRLGLLANHRWHQPPPGTPPPGPTQEQLQKAFAETSVYYTRVFEDLLRRCRAMNCSVDVFFIDTGASQDRWKWEVEHIQAFLQDLCARTGTPYFSTRSLLRDHPELTLPNDGHLNPKGNQVLADFIAAKCSAEWKP
jgi:hypothetical protein